ETQRHREEDSETIDLDRAATAGVARRRFAAAPLTKNVGNATTVFWFVVFPPFFESGVSAGTAGRRATPRSPLCSPVSLWLLFRRDCYSAAPMPERERLHGSLSTVEYFTFGFGTMIGVGWLVLMDDWLARGGPGGGMLGYLVGGLLLFPIAHTYGRLVPRIRDAGAEIAYTEGVFPPFIRFAAGWTTVLSYAIVCPWEAVATGNLLARVFPSLNSYHLYG